MKNMDKMGVYILSSHLIITMAIIILYGILSVMGKEDQTLQMVLIAAVSFWFGAMGKDSLRPAKVEVVTTEKEKGSVSDG